MVQQPTLFLTVGLPCTGKTTAALCIEIEQNALRLTKDEWVKALYGQQNPPSAQSALRQAAADRGALVEMRYFELSPAEQRSRRDRRQAEAPHTTWPMSDAELARWAASIDIPTPGELDCSEPIDEPPAGFATWDEWRRHRWPPSVSTPLLTENRSSNEPRSCRTDKP